MTFVVDQVRRIDAQLDRAQLADRAISAAAAPERRNTGEVAGRVRSLQNAVRGLSAGGNGGGSGLVKAGVVKGLLGTLEEGGEGEEGARDEYETELEWLVVAKATTQVYGHVLGGVLDGTLALAEHLWYWDGVLASRPYTVLYGVQVSPLRLWDWGSRVWEDVRTLRGDGIVRDASDTVTERWRRFYGLVRQVMRERSVAEVHEQMLSPMTRIRGEVRQKQKALENARIRNANALGVLLGEGLANESVHGEGFATPHEQYVRHQWRASVARNVVLMEAVLAKIDDGDTPGEKFDAAVGELTDEDPLFAVGSYELPPPPRAVAERLSRVLVLGLSQYSESTRALVRQHGKPSRLVRYWLPITVGFLSSSTVLRMLVSRQADVVQWMQDLGGTVVDFWQNWVVGPARNVIGTIRHDEASAISIVSKRSLEGDRESLERMVVDFARDHPGNTTASGSSLTEAEIADIRSKVREGDLTPVLKAYEKDLHSPWMGALRGNLIRALLIQVQKTKVDVEIAMGGIDSVLKSQELLIGFIGLTPGLLVAYGLTHYVRSSLSEKRGSSKVRKQGKMLRQLRNIDRILTSSTANEYGELPYKDQGLLLCEVHVLRESARLAMPHEIYREFSVEADELCDVRMGVERQMRVANRIRWAYGKWLT